MWYVFDAASDATVAGPFLDHADAEERALALEAENTDTEVGFVNEPEDDDHFPITAASGVRCNCGGPAPD